MIFRQIDTEKRRYSKSSMILTILALLGFRELHGYDGPLQYLSQGNPDSMTAVQVQAMRLYIRRGGREGGTATKRSIT